MKRFLIAAFPLVFLSLALSSCGDNTSSERPEGALHPEEVAAGEMPKLLGEVSYALEDGEERNRENPTAYPIPDKERRENLKEGETVELIFDLSNDSETVVERMWVKVKKRDASGTGYLGVLDSDPVSTSKLKVGLEVAFEPRHVVEIYDATPKAEEEQEEN